MKSRDVLALIPACSRNAAFTKWEGSLAQSTDVPTAAFFAKGTSVAIKVETNFCLGRL